MQIAVHFLAYNVNRFINVAIENAAPHVDKIYIAYPSRPFGYINHSRLTKSNPTHLEDIDLSRYGNKIEIIEGDWLTDEDVRNECLRKARQEGFDWFIIQDADEYYTEASWNQLKKFMLRDKRHDHLTTTWYNFWKSGHFVLMYPNGQIKDINAGFAIRCQSETIFSHKRCSNHSNDKILDYPCYHYGYVMSDKEMMEKITTWSHSNEIHNANAWFEKKWVRWNELTRYLNPIQPYGWDRAIRFPLEQPPFAEQFALDITITYERSLSEKIEQIYDEKRVEVYKSLKRIGGTLRNW